MSDQQRETLDSGGMIYAAVGIGGWLLLPIVHLVVNAGVIAYFMTIGFLNGYNQGRDPSAGPDAPTAMSASQIMLAGIGFFDAFIVVYALHCLQRLLRKKADVPSLMIVFYVLLIAKTAAYAYVLFLYPDARANAKSLGEAAFAAAKIAIAAAIWIPYFLVSVRVKNTFRA